MPFIRESIDSLLQQSFQDFELLIGDDGSTDDTRGVIDEYTDKRIRRYYRDNNAGKAATVNKLCQHATGEFITIHDADDVSHHNRLALQMAAFENDPELAMCGTSFYEMDAHGRILQLVVLTGNYDQIKTAIREGSQFHGPTVVFRRSVLPAIGGLYRNIRMGEDVDFTMRVVEKFKSINLTEALYYYRIHAQSTTKDINYSVIRGLYEQRLIVHLAKERETTGLDSLMTRNTATFENLWEEVRQEYNAKQYYYMGKRIGYLRSVGLRKEALRLMGNALLSAIKKTDLKMIKEMLSQFKMWVMEEKRKPSRHYSTHSKSTQR